MTDKTDREIMQMALEAPEWSLRGEPIGTLERIDAFLSPTAMDEAIAAGNGTLHGAIDYWQGRAERAEAGLAAALRERLAQPEQKPVAWLSTDSIGESYLPTPPQKREWQGLTDEEYNRLVIEHLGPHALTGGKMSVYDAFLLAIRATEAKLKEKND